MDIYKCDTAHFFDFYNCSQKGNLTDDYIAETNPQRTTANLRPALLDDRATALGYWVQGEANQAAIPYRLGNDLGQGHENRGRGRPPRTSRQAAGEEKGGRAMSVKLYNHSALSYDVLLAMLTEAKRLAGAKGDVIVRITRGTRGGGEAKECCAVREAYLLGRKDWHKYTRRIKTSGGRVEVTPYLDGRDPLDAARYMFETSIHEFAHIVQFQTHLNMNGNHLVFAKGQGHKNRRPEWKRRAEEIDAENRTEDALARLAKQRDRKARVDDIIIALAIEIEGVKGKQLAITPKG